MKDLITEEMKTAEKDATCEAPVMISDFLQELMLLLNDYFVGDFQINGDGIDMTFKNGQKFCLAVKNAD